jgi:hypothetical protein
LRVLGSLCAGLLDAALFGFAVADDARGAAKFKFASAHAISEVWSVADDGLG